MPSAEQIRTAITAFVDASSPGEPRRWAALAATAETMGAALAAAERMAPPLTHGAFQCAPDLAAECAHVLNAAEGAYGIDPGAALDELGRYLDGSATADETIAELELLAREGDDGTF